MIVLGALLLSTALPTLEDETRKWLSDRGASTTAADLALRWQKQDPSLARLEAVVRAGSQLSRTSPYKPGAWTYDVPLACDHVDYATKFHVFVPTSYRSAAPSKLLIVGHGGNSAMSLDYADMAARGGVAPWTAIAESNGYIVAAPLTERGWGWIGDSIVFSLISKLRRELAIDPDRVYLTGHSMGGHLTWRSALAYPDRWAAVSPMSGGYDWVEQGVAPMLYNVPGYATFGKREPYQINEFNKRLATWTNGKPFDWVFDERDGGHEIFDATIPLIGRFFDSRVRSMYPRQLYIKHKGMPRIDQADPHNPQWSTHNTWRTGRPIDRRTFYWVQLDDFVPGEKDRWRIVHATLKDEHTIVLRCSGVRSLRLFLHPKMVDLSKPVTVIVNGKETICRPRRDARKMLELAREFDDPGRVFFDSVRVSVTSDVDAPLPRTPRQSPL